jgi:hypothetical protein
MQTTPHHGSRALRPAEGSGAVTLGGPGLPTALRLTVKVPGGAPAVRIAEPVTVGVPFPAGVCTDEQRICLSGNSGSVPVQASVLERWPDGSIRWVLLDFQANAPDSYDVSLATPAAATVGGLVLRERDGVAEVEFAALVARVCHKGEFRIDVTAGHRPGPARRISIDVTGRDGTVLRPETSSVEWEMKGALRSVLRITASVGAESRNPLELLVRLHFYTRLPTVRFEVTLMNPRRAEHQDGFWELGDAGSDLIRDCSVRIETGRLSRVRCSVDPDHSLDTLALPFELYQDSSGGDNWHSTTHVNRDGVIPVSFCGYRLKAGSQIREGRRATPIAWMDDGVAPTGIAIRHFWQNAPKCLEADHHRMVLRLLPRQFADLHEIQGGEQKTHVFHVAFGDDAVSAPALDWARRPALATASPEWYCGAGAVPYLTPVSEDPNADYVELVNSIIEGPESFEARRELIDEYGWRNFGDIYADHEAVFHKGPRPMVSHYNNQYDAIAGFAYHFLRSADVRWWAALEELAWHVRDIDIYRTAHDKSAYSGGLFWHTCHYVDAGRSSHRSYPKVDGVGGGGPANEHAYSTGLMLHYLLSGETASRDAAVGLAEWVLRLDDGTRTPFRWLSRADTGLASKTHSTHYHGPGRGAGNAINVLLNGYRLTGRAAFLEKAEELIRRCIHPHDDISAHGLLDPESRWSYTVFLQALGRYLDEKIVRNEIDERYAYARQSLLHYARWMAGNEYLYLEKPEILEYPTETWAAQDMRKSDVFKFAAKHASGAERTVFLTRADYFFRESLRALEQWPTRFTARPRVLMMTCGFMHAAFQLGADGGHAPEPPAIADFGQPITFVPQKAVVRQRLNILGAAAVVGAAVLVGFAVVVL